MKILVFDSGVGGFSILRHLLVGEESHSFVYLADQANFPYGSKSADWITARLSHIAHWAKDNKPDLFVMACNTATVAGIQKVRDILACPVVGVEPVVKPLAKYPNSLLLATTSTAKSSQVNKLLHDHPSNIEVHTPDGLADAIEYQDAGKITTALEGIANKVRSGRFRAVGLSCTHYPLVIEELQKLVPDTEIFDPSSAVVRQIRSKLQGRQVLSSQHSGRVFYFTTGSVVKLKKAIKKYLDINADPAHLDI